MTTALISPDRVIQFAYLISAVLFILSLKWMSSPSSARRGVWAGELGMLLAICATLLHHGIVDYRTIAIGLVLGVIIGVPLGRVHMTAVPSGRRSVTHSARSAWRWSARRNTICARRTSPPS